jgi:hypothetical protein
MPASITPNAVNQFIDINGAPLVGGFVHMYEVGTLVEKDTWQNSAQTVLNLNPIELNSRGQAVIYGVGSYRQILKDSAGNTIWDKNIENFQESVFGPQVTVAVGTTVNLGAATSNNVLISGAGTVNSLGTGASAANPVYLIHFDAIQTYTYNVTSMYIPGGANLVTTAGASALVEVTDAAAGYWRFIQYFPTTSSGALGTAAVEDIGTSGATVPLLNGGNTWSGINRFQKQTYGDEVGLTIVAGATTPDFALSNNWTGTTAVSLTINNPSNTQPGQSGIFRITQTNAALTLSWGTSFKASGGIATVSLSGVNNAIDYFAFYVHSSTEIVVTPILNIT